jgi:hypothetical protein
MHDSGFPPGVDNCARSLSQGMSFHDQPDAAA